MLNNKINTLLKNKFMFEMKTAKHNNVNIIAYSKQRRIGGRVMFFIPYLYKTDFDMLDYVKISKKQRSDKAIRYEKDLSKYQYAGICISHKKDKYSIKTSFLMRNVFDGFAYELRVPLLSGFFEVMGVDDTIIKFGKIKRNRYYFLRMKELPYSLVNFFFLFGTKERNEHRDNVLWRQGRTEL